LDRVLALSRELTIAPIAIGTGDTSAAIPKKRMSVVFSR
jgi:hypothetical protein